MNVINLTIKPANFKNYTVMLDGQVMKLKKNNRGDYCCRYETQNDNVDLTICKVFELHAKLWWLWAILFYIIGFLGIFSAGHDRKCQSVSYRLNTKLNPQSNVMLTFLPFMEGRPAVQCAVDCYATEMQNVYYVDRLAKKRRKLLAIPYLLLWILGIAAAVILVYKVFLGF